MTLILSGTDGLSDVDGSAATPAIRGTDANTGIFFPAADTIAFSEGGAEIARFDSSGNLLVGTATTSTLSGFTVVGQFKNSIGILNGSADEFSGALLRESSSGNSISLNADPANLRAGSYLGFGVDGSERARIESSGKLLVGTSTSSLSPNSTMVLADSVAGGAGIQITKTSATTGGGLIGTANGPGLVFYSHTGTVGSEAFTERMRIDSSGNLLVGTTTADGRITAHASTSNSSSLVLVGNTSAGNTLIRIRADGLYNLGLQTNSPFNLTSTGANAILFSDGTFGRATSSLKYKRNVEDTSHGLSDVLKLRAITYKSKNERDGDTVFGGLIAEEVDALGLNEFVQYAEDGTPDSIYYANMVSLAFKAIQEQQAIITQLQADVASLQAPQGTP